MFKNWRALVNKVQDWIQIWIRIRAWIRIQTRDPNSDPGSRVTPGPGFRPRIRIQTLDPDSDPGSEFRPGIRIQTWIRISIKLQLGARQESSNHEVGLFDSGSANVCSFQLQFSSAQCKLLKVPTDVSQVITILILFNILYFYFVFSSRKRCVIIQYIINSYQEW